MKPGIRTLFFIFATLYAIALLLFLIGSFGLFGSPSGPLAGVFLVPLGMPWNLFIDILPEVIWPWAAAVSPALNLIVIWLVGRLPSRT